MVVKDLLGGLPGPEQRAAENSSQWKCLQLPGRLLGLPDLTPLHEEMVERMKEQLSENMDPAKLVENYMQGSFSSMEAFQRTMSNFMKSGNKDGFMCRKFLQVNN